MGKGKPAMIPGPQLLACHSPPQNNPGIWPSSLWWVIIYTKPCNYSFLAHIQILPIYWTSEIDAVACIAGWPWTLSSWRMTLGQSLTFLLTLLPTLQTGLIRKKKAGMHRGNSELSWSLRELMDGRFVFCLWKQRCTHQTCEGYFAINCKIVCLFVSPPH